MPLATVFVDIFSKEKTGEVLDHIQLPHGRILRYLLKNGVLKIFEQGNCPRQFSGSWCPSVLERLGFIKPLLSTHLSNFFRIKMIVYYRSPFMSWFCNYLEENTYIE